MYESQSYITVKDHKDDLDKTSKIIFDKINIIDKMNKNLVITNFVNQWKVTGSYQLIC